MEFETLKKSHLKRNIIIGVIAVAVISAIILNFTRAKYKVTQSIPLVNGTINYTASDLNIVAITIDGEKADSIPDGNYTLTENSYCEVNGERIDATLTYDSSTKSFSVSPFTTKGTKCYLDFKQSGIQILATINGSTSNSFPSKSSSYTPDSVTCTNGAKAKFDFTDWAVEVDNVESTTCTVNFKSNINQTFANYLISKACASIPTTDDAAKNCLVNENGYRFEGKNPNNYVLFNDELWRVIGVFNVKTSTGSTQNLVKLIRSDVLDGLAWDGNGLSDWTQSTLKTKLNNAYLNATDVTCNVYGTTVTKTCYFSETGINSLAREMIEKVVWNLGGLSDDEYSASTFYTAERGTTVYYGNPTTWTGKVALMYPSDYGYAALASSCSRGTNLSDYSYSKCSSNNWLNTAGDFEWTLTHWSSYNGSSFSIYIGGVSSRSAVDMCYSVRPSIYLKSNIVINGGDGSRDFPYIIK